MLPDHLAPPFMPTKRPARTFVKRGFYMCCTSCSLTIDYCMCGPLQPQEKAPEDGPAAASLQRRIADCKETK